MSFNPFLILWTARQCCLCSDLLSQLSGNLVSTVASDCQLSVCTGVVPVPYKHLGIGIFFFFPSLKSGWALYAVKFFCAVQIFWGRFLWWTFPDSSLCCCGTSASFSSWRCSLFVTILLLLLAIFSWFLQDSGLKTPEAIPLLFSSIWPDLMLMRPRDTDLQSPLSVLWHGWLCISWFPDL